MIFLLRFHQLWLLPHHCNFQCGSSRSYPTKYWRKSTKPDILLWDSQHHRGEQGRPHGQHQPGGGVRHHQDRPGAAGVLHRHQQAGVPRDQPGHQQQHPCPRGSGSVSHDAKGHLLYSARHEQLYSDGSFWTRKLTLR